MTRSKLLFDDLGVRFSLKPWLAPRKQQLGSQPSTVPCKRYRTEESRPTVTLRDCLGDVRASLRLPFPFVRTAK